MRLVNILKTHNGQNQPLYQVGLKHFIFFIYRKGLLICLKIFIKKNLLKNYFFFFTTSLLLSEDLKVRLVLRLQESKLQSAIRQKLLQDGAVDFLSHYYSQVFGYEQDLGVPQEAHTGLTKAPQGPQAQQLKIFKHYITKPSGNHHNARKK